MDNKKNVIYGVCPKCQSAKTLRVDRQRNLFHCEECKTWFEI